MIKRSQVRFIDSCRLMSSGLDSLVTNLVGVNDMKSNIIKNPCKISYCVSHGKCQQCYSGGYSKQLDKVTLQLTFLNTYKHCGNNECFRLLFRKGFIPMSI